MAATLVICMKVTINYNFHIVAAAIGKPRARVPYSSLSSSSVKNFPAGLKFGPPSSFSTKNLKHILDVAEDIEFVGTCAMFSLILIFTQVTLLCP